MLNDSRHQRNTDLTEKMLRSVLAAIRKGTLRWSQYAPDQFHSTGALAIEIRQITPLIAGDTETAGPQAFQIDVEGVCASFWAGSTGGELIAEILATGIESWAGHRANLHTRIRQAIKKLT